jgi:hypothetical protein
MKKVLIALMMMILVTNFGFAMGAPVIDITAIIAAIENGYKLYEQCQQVYNQIQLTYQQLENQVKSFKAFDLKELDTGDPLKAWENIMSYANRQMNYVNNIQNLMNAKNMTIGNFSYSYADFWNSPAQTVGSAVAGAVEFQLFDPFVERTVEEKAAFHSKYGMTPGNYMKYNMIGDAMAKKGAELAAVVANHDKDNKSKEAQEEAAQLDKVISDAKGSSSVVAQAQAANAIALEQTKELERQTSVMSKFALGWYEAHEKLEVKNLEDEARRKNNVHAYPEGFVKIIEGIDSSKMIGRNQPVY